MLENVTSRIDALVIQGDALVHSFSSEQYWAKDVASAQAWISSAANAILFVVPHSSRYVVEITNLITHENSDTGIPLPRLQKILGVLKSVRDEAQYGLITKLEYQVFATAFDDFLDHASEFHRSGKAREAGVLAAIVLEDTIKRIAAKNGIASAGKSLEPLVDELTKADIFTQVKAKRIKAYAGVRNPALHAEWDKFDIKDAGDLISGVRELIDGYL